VNDKLSKDKLISIYISHIIHQLKNEKDGEIRDPKTLSMLKAIGYDWEKHKHKFK